MTINFDHTTDTITSSSSTMIIEGANASDLLEVIGTTGDAEIIIDAASIAFDSRITMKHGGTTIYKILSDDSNLDFQIIRHNTSGVELNDVFRVDHDTGDLFLDADAGVINLTSPMVLGGPPVIAIDSAFDPAFAIPAVGPGTTVDAAFVPPVPAADPSVPSVVTLGFGSPPPAGLVFNAFVTGPGAVTVRVQADGATTFGGAPIALRVMVVNF